MSADVAKDAMQNAQQAIEEGAKRSARIWRGEGGDAVVLLLISDSTLR